MGELVTILAIESSCDDTSAAVCINGSIFSNVIASQKVHEQYGGVVPELASRAHIQNIVPVVSEALKQADENLQQSGLPPMHEHPFSAIAYTSSPGLIGSLLVGAQFAKSLALSYNIPLIAVHHMQAHVLSNLIGENPPSFPFLCLTVSGGHTQIVRADSPSSLHVLGQTIDDAAGEAFDKSAKLLGLPYPGGPLIDKHAKDGDPFRFRFAEPKVPELNFSFSGLKTSILYFLEKQQAADSNFIQENLPDICASVQNAIVNILLKKLEAAVHETGIKTVCLAGGVSANSYLRKRFMETAGRNKWNYHIPEFQYCTDNAAMIAITAYHQFLEGNFSSFETTVSAR